MHTHTHFYKHPTTTTTTTTTNELYDDLLESDSLVRESPHPYICSFSKVGIPTVKKKSLRNNHIKLLAMMTNTVSDTNDWVFQYSQVTNLIGVNNLIN